MVEKTSGNAPVSRKRRRDGGMKRNHTRELRGTVGESSVSSEKRDIDEAIGIESHGAGQKACVRSRVLPSHSRFRRHLQHPDPSDQKHTTAFCQFHPSSKLCERYPWYPVSSSGVWSSTAMGVRFPTLRWQTSDSPHPAPHDQHLGLRPVYPLLTLRYFKPSTGDRRGTI